MERLGFVIVVGSLRLPTRSGPRFFEGEGFHHQPTHVTVVTVHHGVRLEGMRHVSHGQQHPTGHFGHAFLPSWMAGWEGETMVKGGHGAGVIQRWLEGIWSSLDS